MEPIERVRVRAREGETEVERTDTLAVEEPLQIRVCPRASASPSASASTGASAEAVSFVTTMRTPGNDEELAAGLLFAEGVLAARGDLIAIDRLADPRVAADLRENVVVATLAPAALQRALGLARSTVMGSACGVCGRTSIESVIPPDAQPLASELRVSPEVLYSLPDRLRERQSVFAQTGGLHAAALFTGAGEIVALREDIGRHNATDKLVGGAWLAGEVPLEGRVLMVSGRAGFEIVQKAFAAGIPIVASVSAPSSLAVELAEAGGLTLVGFLRGRRFNVYSNPQRVTGP